MRKRKRELIVAKIQGWGNFNDLLIALLSCNRIFMYLL